MKDGKIDSIGDFSNRGLTELILELQKWFKARNAAAPAAAGGDGIKFNEANEELPLRWLQITTNDENTDGYGVFIVATGDSDAVFGGSPVQIRGDQISLLSSDGLTGTTFVNIPLETSGKIQVRDAGSNPIFEVREDGTVHIKTGSSVIADL